MNDRLILLEKNKLFIELMVKVSVGRASSKKFYISLLPASLAFLAFIANK